MSEVTNKLAIGAYIHCKKCVKDMPDGVSPQEYTNYDVGWTEKGIQVWCVRHDCNVVNIDFEGHQHPADTTSFDKQLKVV